MSIRCALLSAVTAVCLSGCSILYTFPVTVVVRTSDGNPLADAEVSFRPPEGQDRFKADAQGICAFERQASGGSVSGGNVPSWTAWVAAEGYETRQVVFRPDRLPESKRDQVPIRVEVRLLRTGEAHPALAVAGAVLAGAEPQ